MVNYKFSPEYPIIFCIDGDGVIAGRIPSSIKIGAPIRAL